MNRHIELTRAAHQGTRREWPAARRSDVYGICGSIGVACGTTVITTGDGLKPVAAQCGPVKGANGNHGGGTIHIGG